MKKLIYISALILICCQSYSQFRPPEYHNMNLFRADSINKDETRFGVSYPDDVSQNGTISATIYTSVDTLSTNAGYARFQIETYATDNNSKWSLIDWYIIETAGRTLKGSVSFWDTTYNTGDINTIGLKQVITPIDTTQALKVESGLIWNYKEANIK